MPVSDAPVMPPPTAMAKSLRSTPVTDSENVTFHETLAELIGEPLERAIEETTGGTISTLYAWPVKLPLPAPLPPSALDAMSITESLSTRFRPRLPLLPVEAVTV